MFHLASLALAGSIILPFACAQRGYSHGHGSSRSGLLTNVTIFDPPENYTIPRTLYARSLLLNQNCEEDNVILATWENYLPTQNNTVSCPPNCPVDPYIPIYQSYDGGETWSERAKVHDQVNGWGLRYQPDIYELSETIGNYSAGTLLLAANSIPADLSETKIDVYASSDKGFTWHFVSSVARGGVALPNNGETPVWEPFWYLYNGEIVLYYSDQRDPAHGQKMVHQTSSDLLNWGPVVDDIAYDEYSSRPGMPTISELPFGNYMITYEYGGAPEGDFAVYYRVSNSPLTFDSKPGMLLQATDGTIPFGSPYNVWTPAGGPLGTIVVSSGTNREVFLNHNLGAPGAWTAYQTPAGSSYTRSLMVMPDTSKIMIVAGGVLGGENNSVQATVVDITPYGPSLPKCSKKDHY